MFRPFIDEIIVGRIRGSSADGVKGIIIIAVVIACITIIMIWHSLSGSMYNNNAVSLGFFDDIIIPHQNLQHPKRLYPLTVHKTGILMSLNIISALYNIIYA